MDTEYDPSDQFFQAFKAGYLEARDHRLLYPEMYLWDKYIAWLFDEGVTT